MHSLTSALDGAEWSASCPGHFTPRERAHGTHWIEGWVDPRAVLDAVVKRKIPSPRRESNPSTPIVQPVAQRYTDWAITLSKWDYTVAWLHLINANHVHNYFLAVLYFPCPCSIKEGGAELHRLGQQQVTVTLDTCNYWTVTRYHVQTGFGAHPASYPVGTGVLSLEVRRLEPEANHSPPSSAEVK
jgi:hypothetical protein